MKLHRHKTDLVWRIDKEHEKTVRGFSLGIAGISLAALLAISAIPNPSWTIEWSSCCFAIALPFAILGGLVSHSLALGGYSTKGTRILSSLTGHTTRLTVFSGTVLLVYHTSRIAAAILAIIGVLAWIFYSWFLCSYRNASAALADRERANPGLPAVQPPLPSRQKRQ